MISRNVILVICCLVIGNASAQKYIGIACDVGNKMSYNQNQPVSLSSRVSFSGSVAFINREEIRSKWFIEYGAAAGALGYGTIIKLIDSLSLPGNTLRFFDYSTIHASLQIGIGKQFRVGRQQAMFILGTGATRYFSIPSDGVSFTLGVISNGSDKIVFDFSSVSANTKAKGFIKLSSQFGLSQRFIVGIQYTAYFSPALKGAYNYYYTKEPNFGTLELTQKYFSLIAYMKLGKKKSGLDFD